MTEKGGIGGLPDRPARGKRANGRRPSREEEKRKRWRVATF